MISLSPGRMMLFWSRAVAIHNRLNGNVKFLPKREIRYRPILQCGKLGWALGWAWGGGVASVGRSTASAVKLKLFRMV